MEKIKNVWKENKYICLYIIVMILCYLSLIIYNDKLYTIILLLMLGFPIIIIIGSFVAGLKHGFNFLIPLISIIWFLPAILYPLNTSALVYIIIYFICSLMWNYIGGLIYKRLVKEKK